MTKTNLKWALPVAILTLFVIFAYWRWGGSPEDRYQRIVGWNLTQNEWGLMSDQALVTWLLSPDEEIPSDLKVKALQEWMALHSESFEAIQKKLPADLLSNLHRETKTELVEETYQPLDFSFGSVLLPTPFVIGMDGDPEPLNTNVQKASTDKFQLKVQKADAGEVSINVSYLKDAQLVNLKKTMNAEADATSWGSVLVDDSKIYLFAQKMTGAILLDGVPDSVQFDWEKVEWAEK